MNKVKVNGVEFAYRLEGQGQPLVLVSGYSRDYTAWDMLLPVLVERFQVLVFDNQGVGKTQDDGGPLTANEMANNIWGLIDALGLQNPIIAGVSMGGAIAQAMAVERSDDIKQLLLVNTAASWSITAKKMLQAVMQLHQANVSLSIIIDVCLPWLFGRDFLQNSAYVEQYRQSVFARAETLSLSGLARQANVIMTFNLQNELAKISVPTNVIISQEDLMVLPENSKKMAAAIADSKIQWIPGGHSSQIEQPQALLAAMQVVLVGAAHE